jgi:hypothetical protein
MRVEGTMGMLILPVLVLLTLGTDPKPSAAVLEDFSRLAKLSGVEMSLVDREGSVREGTLVTATADHLTMRFAAGEKIFARTEIVSAERLRDGRKDGAIKGAIFGAVIGLAVAPYYDNDAQKAGIVARSAALYAGIGYVMDASQTHRQPIYRAPASVMAPTPIKVSVRF